MELNHEININNLQFGWDTKKGRFLFEGEDSILFWISTAMKEFFDTIEEVSGKEPANVVLETTGFRQGLVVGEYFQNIKQVSTEEAANLITRTYGSAGWGSAVVVDINVKEQTAIMHLKDDWEYKINVAQGKQTGGTFLPAHYAGIFSGLFNENIWYSVKQYQIEGHEHTIVEYFPSSITVKENIHALIRSREAKEIARLEELVESKTDELQTLVKTLSSPMIPVIEGIVVVPLLGKYDEERMEELIEKTLNNLPAYKAKYLILDLTGLDRDLTPHTSTLIDKLAAATSLIGTKTILVGISGELSIIMAQKNIDLSRLDCFQTLEHGIYYAFGKKGLKIVEE
ncbi:STAS domain-containing protein [Bacillus sp. FJAT-44742]|uniref:STAS domain-containing protein n=1 Tax=Bacillus sp. FJAT-44742 TaxID=2014005 RepID=UPI000C23A224|nr:STAS domain-containing protein [Bacillus sp. FJAT-44742]